MDSVLFLDSVQGEMNNQDRSDFFIPAIRGGIWPASPVEKVGAGDGTVTFPNFLGLPLLPLALGLLALSVTQSKLNQ